MILLRFWFRTLKLQNVAVEDTVSNQWMADACHVHPDLMHSSNQRRFPRIGNNLATDCFEIWYLHVSAIFCNAFRYSQHVCSWIFCWSEFIFLLIPMLFFRFVGFVKMSTYRKPPALCFGFFWPLLLLTFFWCVQQNSTKCLPVCGFAFTRQ